MLVVLQHFQHLLYTIPNLSTKDPLDMRLVDNYWCPTDGVRGATYSRNWSQLLQKWPRILAGLPCTMPTIIGLVGYPVPTTIKYRLINCLSVLAKSTEIVHWQWQVIETAQLAAGQG